MARRWEWEQQVLLASLFSKWIDPATTFATAVDSVARDAMSGSMRRRRGVVPGVPDNLIVHRTKRTGCILVAVEMKSPGGKCSPGQLATREALLRAGATWWEARSAAAAMVAVSESGVRFREIVHADGTAERWKKPRLADWEKPRRDPVAEPRPLHPVVAAQRRAARQRRKARQPQARETSNREEEISLFSRRNAKPKTKSERDFDVTA